MTAIDAEPKQPDGLSPARRLAEDRRRFAGLDQSRERILPAEVFLRRVDASKDRFGITRAGRLTGLDRIGIPVWMATRPNAANLSVSQGKGLDDGVAKLGAMLESIEMSVAESPVHGAFPASRDELKATSVGIADTSRHLRIGQTLDGARTLRWVEGFDLLHRETVFVPEEMTMLRDEPGTIFQQTSDGFGAGGCLLEAAHHGLRELVERDAAGLWSFRSATAILEREVACETLGDDVLAALDLRIGQGGLRLRLFDMTNGLGVPAFMATIAPATPPVRGWRHLDLSSGTGAHPRPERAARQAVLESIQTRMTTIAGARDDVAPGGYDRPLSPDLAVYVADRADKPGHRPSVSEFRGNGPALFDHLLERLAAIGVRSAILVPMTEPDCPVAVARIFVPDLEQHPQSRNRRLGRRALAALMGSR